MKSMIPTIWLAIAIFVAGCAGEGTTKRDLKAVSFRVTAASDGMPLANREMQVFNGGPRDVDYEFVKSKASAQEHYLRTIVTDTNGCFTLDLSDPKTPTDIIIQPGPPYNIVGFEMASDIAHRKSAFHIRVVRLVTQTGRVERNDIYDLRRKTVRQIPLAGVDVIAPFQVVLLVAEEIRTWAQPPTGGDGKPAPQP